jgi:hypothetical protein
MKRIIFTLLFIVAMAGTAQAKVDLVTLPSRDTVQLTIYNSADMTLVRESRALTLKDGENKLQFSWANTLIDPTSLDLSAEGKKPGLMEYRKRHKRQSAGGDYISDERLKLAGVLHGHAYGKRRDNAPAGLCASYQQQRRRL